MITVKNPAYLKNIRHQNGPYKAFVKSTGTVWIYCLVLLRWKNTSIDTVSLPKLDLSPCSYKNCSYEQGCDS